MSRGMRGLKDERLDEDEIEDEELSFVDKLKELRDKLKLGPHHKMERFGIILSTTLIFLLLFTSVSFVSHKKTMKDITTAQAVFTEDFTFSKSNQMGTIEGVYGNKDKTDVMVLFKFGNPGEMSANAENYELFITKQKKSFKEKDAPDVSFALFGATGYGTVRFQSDEPLKNEILDITIRSNSDFADSVGGGAGEADDESFNTFDQARFYVNVGADDVQTIKGHKKGENDPSKLYVELVADAEDAEIRKEIEEKTKELGKLLNRSQEYSNRLTQIGYEVPKTPWFVEGDYIDDDGIFRPKENVSLSHDIDYWSKGIRDGYLSQVIPSMDSYDEYVAKHSSSPHDNEELAKLLEEKPETVESSVELKNKDGSILLLDSITTGVSTSPQVSAKDSIMSLESTWSTYLNVKSDLQRNLLGQLITLDAEVRSQSVGYSEYKGEGLAYFY